MATSRFDGTQRTYLMLVWLHDAPCKEVLKMSSRKTYREFPASPALSEWGKFSMPGMPFSICKGAWPKDFREESRNSWFGAFEDMPKVQTGKGSNRIFFLSIKKGWTKLVLQGLSKSILREKV